MKKKQEEKKTFAQVFKEYDAVFSIHTSFGYANISFEEQKMVVQFFGDEGQSYEDMTIPLEDIEKTSKFMAELKSMRLQDYQSPLKS